MIKLSNDTVQGILICLYMSVHFMPLICHICLKSLIITKSVVNKLFQTIYQDLHFLSLGGRFALMRYLHICRGKTYYYPVIVLLFFRMSFIVNY